MPPSGIQINDKTKARLPGRIISSAARWLQRQLLRATGIFCPATLSYDQRTWRLYCASYSIKPSVDIHVAASSIWMSPRTFAYTDTRAKLLRLRIEFTKRPEPPAFRLSPCSCSLLCISYNVCDCDMVNIPFRSTTHNTD